MIMDKETLGPAERLIQSLLTYHDHMVHNRPGLVVVDRSTAVGVRWQAATCREEEGVRAVYRLDKQGRRTGRTRVGVLGDDGKVRDGDRVVGEYRAAGLFPEIATWMYRQVAEVWRLDNELAARWASFAYGEEHRDLKVILAAFMLVQGRRGDPVVDEGKVAFFDDDFRDVGEAMLLLYEKDKDGFHPKLLLRVHDVLRLPGVAQINRELGFGRSGRRPFFGRWHKAVEKWLRYREQNPKLLEGLVKAGFRTTAMELARRVGYKPTTPKFFEILRWRQVQAKDGRRELSLQERWTPAETWEGLSEAQIGERIVATKPSYKVIVGRVPKSVGITRALLAAAIEAGCLSDKDLVIATPTLEEMGLLQVPDLRARWERAVRAAEDMRSANLAARVKSQSLADKLVEASDCAVKKAVEQVMKDLRVYFMVDTSGSMEGAIEAAKSYVAKFLQGFPPDRVHVAVFTTTGREVPIKHPSAAGVENAFRGIRAAGGTDYGAGVRALSHHKPTPDEDVLFLFVGDEEAQPFTDAVRRSGLAPAAFGFVKVRSSDTGTVPQSAVRDTAAELGIPCFLIDQSTFADPYGIPRTVRALIAATPVRSATVRATARVSLIDRIVRTDLLKKPVWAA